jgi:tetratricopeptide (TPR) repeat protein
MRLISKWLAVLLTLTVIPLTGCSFLTKLRARDDVNKGVKAFTEQKYDAAAQFFEKSIQLDPNFEAARMYLAIAYTSQFVPGSTDPKSEEMAQKAIETYKEVVDRAEDPNKPNQDAMISIASLYYQLKNYNESKAWCHRVLKIDPQNADAYYRIAVIDYDDTFEKTGVQGENVAYMSPEEKQQTQANIEEALTCLGKALEIRPNYFDAMEYQNLLWREKAKFEEDEKAKAELIRQADLISQKALQLRLKAEEEEAKKPKKLGNIGGK